MIKRVIHETVTEYNTEGKIVRQTVTETTEDDDTIYYPYVRTETPSTILTS